MNKLYRNAGILVHVYVYTVIVCSTFVNGH